MLRLLVYAALRLHGCPHTPEDLAGGMACDEELPPTSFLGLKRVMNNSRRLMKNSRRTGDAPLQI